MVFLTTSSWKLTPVVVMLPSEAATEVATSASIAVVVIVLRLSQPIVSHSWLKFAIILTVPVAGTLQINIVTTIVLYKSAATQSSPGDTPPSLESRVTHKIFTFHYDSQLFEL